MNNERLMNEFLELLQIDSETKHEGEIAAILQTKLEAMGFHVAVDESAAVTGHGAGNIIATLRHVKPGSCYLLYGPYGHGDSWSRRQT